ncbi:MAG: HAMP domain-containing histidine kinase [Ruminococcaceae bacterium]|nr:HAMP domain-containing histidine kinase [Oscillospiraceae bacterium]
MKNKSGMAKLGIKVVIWFCVITMFNGIADAVLDLFGDIISAALAAGDKGMVPVAVGFLFLRLALFILSALIFFLLIRKEIRKISERQIRENNLLYASVAHDLKTPITSISGFAKALEEGRIPEDEKNDIYGIIGRKSDSMNGLVDELFEYSQLGTEEYKAKPEKLDVCSLLREIVADNYGSLEEHDVEVNVEIPDAAIFVNADKRDLTRALTNLVVNTYKHNPSGIRMLVSASSDGKHCVITIADTGDEIHGGNEIFEPFVTENKSRTPGRGTGLGLAITKRVIDRHKGRITLDNNIPGYTKGFVVRLKHVV